MGNKNFYDQVRDFKDTALWSNGSDDFTVNDFHRDTNASIINYLHKFIDLMTHEQSEALESNGEIDQLGHWLALEMSGHGAGFFDSNNELVKSISETVERFNVRFDTLHVDDEGLVNIDFFSYGTEPNPYL